MLVQVPEIAVGGGAVRKVRIGGDAPLALLAGPCVVEDLDRMRRIAAFLLETADRAGLPLVFKSSFDKANRTSIDGHRGPGVLEGLEILARIRAEFGIPIVSDVHTAEQAAQAAATVDLLQIPAFLCRQTDLLLACAATGRPVNLKKGQFLAPWDVLPAVEKLRTGGARGVLVTERGASFGYNNLVVDLRSLPIVRGLGVPVCIDATHAVQLPGGRGTSSGGQREFAPVIARGAVAAGVDAVFLEVHDDPDHAPSDGPNMLPLEWLPRLLGELVAIDRVVRS